MTIVSDDMHHSVLIRAHRIFEGKSPIRGDMWRKFPPSDKLREIRERCMRMDSANIILKRIADGEESALANDEQLVLDTAIEDALDTINYVAFFIMQLEEGARG